MRIENLYPKPPRGDFATCAQVRDDAAATYSTKARDLLDRSGGDAIGAISLLMLAADQRKAAEQTAAPTVSEQALTEKVASLQSILCAVTNSANGQARMYIEDLQALPVGTVVRDEAGQAWTRVDDEDGGVWSTPSRDDTLSSTELGEETTAWMAWVADL